MLFLQQQYGTICINILKPLLHHTALKHLLLLEQMKIMMNTKSSNKLIKLSVHNMCI